MITLSAFDFTTHTRAVGVYRRESARVRRGEGKKGGSEVWTGVVAPPCARATTAAHLYPHRPARIDTDMSVHRLIEERTHACKPTNTQTQIFPSTRRLSVAFLSLPLAVSQIPDDVLTGGLSDWRWGCVMTDQGLYQWPAHCQLAVWRLTGRLKPKTAAVPARLPASLHISFFLLLFFLFSFSLFNPSLASCRSSLGLM